MISKMASACPVPFVMRREKVSLQLDYTSEAKPEKQIARLMMKMTAGINSKFFKVKDAIIGGFDIGNQSAYTCHNGQPHPVD